MIYEGWSKVGVPITEADAAAESERRQKESSASNEATAKSKRRPKRTRKKRKGQYWSDDDSDDFVGDDDKPPTYHALRDEVLDWCAYINTFDVCITTYNVLSQELNVARAVPVRPRREDVVYSSVKRARSPLVICEWYRVIMDEVRYSTIFCIRIGFGHTSIQVQMAGGGKVELVFCFDQCAYCLIAPPGIWCLCCQGFPHLLFQARRRGRKFLTLYMYSSKAVSFNYFWTF